MEDAREGRDGNELRVSFPPPFFFLLLLFLFFVAQCRYLELRLRSCCLLCCATQEGSDSGHTSDGEHARKGVQ